MKHTAHQTLVECACINQYADYVIPRVLAMITLLNIGDLLDLLITSDIP